MPEATETNKPKNAVDLHIIEFMLELNISLECLLINGFVSLGKGAQNDSFYTILSLFFYWTICLAKLEACLRENSISQGDQSWVFIGRTDVEAETLIAWPPNAKSWLIWKDPDAGKDWGREEKGMTEDDMVGWHHWLNGHEFGWTPGAGDGQGCLACCSSWGHKESDTTERLNWTELSPWTELTWAVI